MACFTVSTRPGRWLAIVTALVIGLIHPPVIAGTIVKVQTSLGNFFLELEDEAAPETVANFLNYVNSGRYNGTFVHMVESGGLIRGGAFGFGDCDRGPIPIQTDPPIALEQTGLSNLSGTIAMAHFPDDVNSATSQWFINIGNAPFLDTLNGGHAVFGEVIGNGMSVISNITTLPTAFVRGIPDVPVINFFGFNADCSTFTRDNLVQLVMAVAAENTDQASSNFDNSSGLLNVNVDLESLGFMNLSFSIFATEPQVVIQAQLDSAVALDTPVPDMAQFNISNGELTLPELAVDGTILFRNVVFELTDQQDSLFTLTSFEE